MTTHKEKLIFPNYIFEINDIDIADVYVEYELYEMEITSWKDGKKQEPEIYPQMTIELTGKYNDQEVYFGFDLKKGLKYLNRFKKDEMVEISDLLVEGETFMINLKGENTSVYLNRPTNTKEDMYKEITNFYALKIKKNHFLFKVQIPTERIFAYFEVHFES